MMPPELLTTLIWVGGYLAGCVASIFWLGIASSFRGDGETKEADITMAIMYAIGWPVSVPVAIAILVFHAGRFVGRKHKERPPKPKRGSLPLPKEDDSDVDY